MLTSFYSSKFPSLRQAISKAYCLDEVSAVGQLFPLVNFSDDFVKTSQELAHKLVVSIREKRVSASGVDSLMHEFSLSSQEGIALMCLAESLLRIPDSKTVDKLIRDKLSKGHWENHIGKSESFFVNFVAWGLLLTGKIVDSEPDAGTKQALTSLLRKGGEPFIRQSMNWAMKFLGQQFVMGETISEALKNSQVRQQRGYCFSYDMLGEAALTEEDAEMYFQSYLDAIHSVGQAAKGQGIYQSSGISVKLSALHPRYQRAHINAVMQSLYPRLKQLMLLAQQYQIGLNIDAEESERLELSLDLIERLMFEPELAGFKGIGVVVQAYQKRCPYVIDYLAELARESQHKLMVRLVKGAYWDAEIKKAQVEGYADYPVYTRKHHTDVAYLACAKKLFDAQDAIYPQFATHNAYCVTAIFHMGAGKAYEFQCLHGMGESLYDQIVGTDKFNRTCRIYAPVGSHKTLLAYLVRRLLENGANTSFVNQIVDKSVNIESLLADPVVQARKTQGNKHPQIPLPPELYGCSRLNSKGTNWQDEITLRSVSEKLTQYVDQQWEAAPLLRALNPNKACAIYNPANPVQRVGWVEEASLDDIQTAIYQTKQHQKSWAEKSPPDRADCLKRMADLLEQHQLELMLLMVKEAGKTWPCAANEVREAVDFCRYYASRVLEDKALAARQALGVMVAISPWNFPLAIFLGEVVSALVMGNAVLAKPAEQTTLTAAFATRLLYQAGIPKEILCFLPGQGETVGQALISSPDIDGVIFTGSTAVAKHIARTQAKQDKTQVLIAETGGINAMIVDSSALPEQVVNDVIQSAFDSAGQRCSALRVLCLQKDNADRIIHMLIGAMRSLKIGDPIRLETDIGPVIDEQAKTTILRHQQRLRQVANDYFEMPLASNLTTGHYVSPSYYVLNHWDDLKEEIFGPVLHIIKFKNDELDSVIHKINQLGFGLTMGIHSRIEEVVNEIAQKAEVGNLYINRNMVGAVVGTQPFGGEKQSGTGPKAGGPLYLYTLSQGKTSFTKDREITEDIKWAQFKQKALLLIPPENHAKWLAEFSKMESQTLVNTVLDLPSPTGETNQLRFVPKGKIACISDSLDALLRQLACVCITHNQALVTPTQMTWLDSTWTNLNWIQVMDKPLEAQIAGILWESNQQDIQLIRQQLAAQTGRIVPLIQNHAQHNYEQYKLLHERVITINTTALGGNASLMMLEE